MLNTQNEEKNTEFYSYYIFSPVCEYIDLEYVRMHVICRVNQAEYVIHILYILVVAPQEYVKQSTGHTHTGHTDREEYVNNSIIDSVNIYLTLRYPTPYDGSTSSSQPSFDPEPFPPTGISREPPHSLSPVALPPPPVSARSYPTWPLQDIRSLKSFLALVHHPFIAPSICIPHTIARLLHDRTPYAGSCSSSQPSLDPDPFPPHRYHPAGRPRTTRLG